MQNNLTRDNMIRVIIIALALTASQCEETITIQPFDAGDEAHDENLTTSAIDEYEVISTGIQPISLKIADSSTPEDYDDNSEVEDLKSTHSWTKGRQNVRLEEYAYVVALYNRSGLYRCAGTIITPKLILTAFHCVSADPPYSIRANSKDIYHGGEKHWIQGYLKHPHGHLETDDIALVVLKTRIQNARAVKLIDSQFVVPGGSIVQVLGWGRTKRGNPRILTKVNLKVSPAQKCLKYYVGVTWICTGTRSSCTCDGDDGGPLLLNGQQVGIVSHGRAKKCCSGIPHAHVNVEKYLDWIAYNKQFFV